MSTFALDISRFAQKFGIDANVAGRKIIFDLQGDVMKETPVDTGLLRSSWFVALTAPSGKKATSSDSGAEAKVSAMDSLKAFNWGDTAFLTNNLEYAAFIEFGGSKVKAPAGMLRITVARYQAHLGRWS